MSNHRQHMNHSASQAPGGPARIITSRPAIAGDIPKGFEKRFEPASLDECEFIRLPSVHERCRLTGLSRSALVSTAKAAGAFISVRLPGKVRGAVLIDKARLMEFLRSQVVMVKEGEK
jgi:hypothetical protein